MRVDVSRSAELRVSEEPLREFEVAGLSVNEALLPNGAYFS